MVSNPISKIDVSVESRINALDLGGVTRLDLTQVGAHVPEKMLRKIRQELVGLSPPPELDESAQREAWAAAQNRAIIEQMTQQAHRLGGDFSSFAEWSVLNGALYDGADMRKQRAGEWGPDYRAAATTLACTNPQSGWGVRLQATGYIQHDPSVHFRQYVWKPEALYDTEFMALAPVVVTELADLKLLHFSGLVGWDKKIEPQFADDPAKQTELVFDMLEAALAEAGGSLDDVMRIQPYCQGLANVALLRQEINRRWQDAPPPSQFYFDSVSFGNPPRLFFEMPVLAILPGEGVSLAHDRLALPDREDSRLVIKRTRTAKLDWLCAGELTPTQAGSAKQEASEVVEQVNLVLDQAGMKPDNLGLLFVFAGHPDHVTAMSRLAKRHLPFNAVHIVPSYPMTDLLGRQIKAELTACRSHRSGAFFPERV